jgi:hypothetical protein
LPNFGNNEPFPAVDDNHCWRRANDEINDKELDGFVESEPKFCFGTIVILRDGVLKLFLTC